MPYIRARIGSYFKNEWTSFVSEKAGDHEQPRKLYHELMSTLGNEIRET